MMISRVHVKFIGRLLQSLICVTFHWIIHWQLNVWPNIISHSHHLCSKLCFRGMKTSKTQASHHPVVTGPLQLPPPPPLVLFYTMHVIFDLSCQLEWDIFTYCQTFLFNVIPIWCGAPFLWFWILDSRLVMKCLHWGATRAWHGVKL